MAAWQGFLEILLILASTQTKWPTKMTPLANILEPRAAQSPRSATELQTPRSWTRFKKRHIMNIEINTKWLNNSSGDRAR